MREAGVDLLFLAPSSDLEYLTGVERMIPTFGQSQYAHGWVAGAFFRNDRDPVFVLPRMMLFDVVDELPGELVVVGERDDGPALFAAAARGLGGPVATLAVGDRVWAETELQLMDALAPMRLVTGSSLVNELRRTKSAEELAVMERACRVADATMAAVAPHVQPGATMLELVEEVEHAMRVHGSRVPSFTTHVFTGFGEGKSSADETRTVPVEEGDVVMFDFGAVVDGYCSDFGRTVCVGEPGAEVRDAHALVLAAQEAGRAALRPGVPASEVFLEAAYQARLFEPANRRGAVEQQDPHVAVCELPSKEVWSCSTRRSHTFGGSSPCAGLVAHWTRSRWQAVRSK